MGNGPKMVPGSRPWLVRAVSTAWPSLFASRTTVISKALLGQPRRIKILTVEQSIVLAIAFPIPRRSFLRRGAPIGLHLDVASSPEQPGEGWRLRKIVPSLVSSGHLAEPNINNRFRLGSVCGRHGGLVNSREKISPQSQEKE